MAATGAAASSHPVQLTVEYPERLSRWKIFFKGLFLIPNLIVLGFVGWGFFIISFLAWWAVLFTGRYPKGLFDFSESYFRWSANLSVYGTLLRDEYPPFSGAAGRYPAVSFSIAYPGRMNQILLLFKWLTVIPTAVAYLFVAIAATLVQFLAWWAILITGHMPRGMFNLLVGTIRWSLRISAYWYMMTDAYPPFRLTA